MDLIKSLFGGDKVIWIIFMLLCMISIVEVFSAASTLTYKSGDHLAPISQHCLFLLVGCAVVVAVHKLPHKLYRLIPVVTLPVSVVLLVVTMFTADKVNSAARWMTIAGIQFQPSEIGKMAVVTSVALILSMLQQADGSAHPKAFKYIMLTGGGVCALILPENFSTGALLFAVCILMMVVGRVPFRQWGRLVAGLVLLVVTAATVAWSVPDDTWRKVPMAHRVPVWKARVTEFVAPERVPPMEYDINEKAQTAHAHIAIASSNLFGKMPGNSVERDFLSQAFSDFIFAIIIEELGLLGGGMVIFLYIILLIRVGRIAAQCDKKYLSFMIMGIALLFVAQALLNMMVAVGLFPVTGQPLPLISKGGTSTLVNCVYIGLILGVSRYVEQLRKQTAQQEIEAVVSDEDTTGLVVDSNDEPRN